MHEQEAPVACGKQVSVVSVQHVHQLIELSPQLVGQPLQLLELSSTTAVNLNASCCRTATPATALPLLT